MVHVAIPSDAEHPNLLNGLVAKRAEIAGQIEFHQAAVRRLVGDLDAVEATIRVFDPNVDLDSVLPRPVPPRHAAFKGEVTRIVFACLRKANPTILDFSIAQMSKTDGYTALSLRLGVRSVGSGEERVEQRLGATEALLRKPPGRQTNSCPRADRWVRSR